MFTAMANSGWLKIEKLGGKKTSVWELLRRSRPWCCQSENCYDCFKNEYILNTSMEEAVCFFLLELNQNDSTNERMNETTVNRFRAEK